MKMKVQSKNLNKLRLLNFKVSLKKMIKTRVAEVTQRREGPSPKSLNWDESFSPNIRFLS